MIKRLVNGIECDIEANDKDNMYIFEYMAEVRNDVWFHLDSRIPDEIKNSINENVYLDFLNRAVEYVIDIVKTSPISNGTFIEDGLCYFYDILERDTEDKDDYSYYYTMFYCKPSEQRIIQEFANTLHVKNKTVADPMVHVIDDMVQNAIDRDVKLGEINDDVYWQLSELTNNDMVCYFDEIIDKWIIDNIDIN